MKLKLNNKGYMLVEIILASALAFGLAFFIIVLTIKLKNKNDDLVVETLISTDREIINNKLMDYAKEERDNFDCSKLTIENSTIKYDGNIIDIVNEYGNIESDKKECSTDLGKISIKIPITVPQMPDKEYDIIFDYKYEIGDMIAPTCSLSIEENIIKATYSDNEGGSGIDYYGWESSYAGENSETKEVSIATHTYYVKDKAGNSDSCSIEVIATTSKSCNCQTCGGQCHHGTYQCCKDYCNKYGECDAICGTCSYDNCDPTYTCNCQTCYSCSTGYTKANDSYCYK